MTYSDFKILVSQLYHTGAQSTGRENAALAAVAHYVKAEILREVDSDLPASKSCRDAFAAAKVVLAGYTITSDFATVKAAVRPLITVDAERAGIFEPGGLIDKYIQQGMDEINGLVTLFDNYILSAVIEIQRHVVCYRTNQRSTYKLGDAGVVVDGAVSKITLPSQSQFKQLLHGSLYDDLAANTAYAVDDLVQSNGRVYKCSTAGTSANPLGSGLTSTDGDEELSGTAGFEYYGPLNFVPGRPVNWLNRQSLQQDSACEYPLFTINPQGTELWLYPAIDADHVAMIEWDGLKTSFAGGDSTSFDQPAAQFAAEWVRGMIQKNIGEDARAAAASFSVAQGLLKRLWMDCVTRS